ncbi:MAG TPA: twin-arginine translocase subunit TatC [Desulfomonilaceae bacterium]|nr:twin-arginine translocase subunit TatC [Desulfomonilaceae bacterium]
MNDDEGRMPFLDHLEELRKRLIRSVTAVLIGFAVCLYFSDPLFHVLAAPIKKLLPQDSALVFTGLPDPFFIYLKVAFLGGLFLALPYILYQLWKFVYPGLHVHERKMAAPFVIFAASLFYSGGLFAYFLVFPAAFGFFLSYTSVDLRPMIAIRDYVSLVIMLMLAFGAVFETPILIVFLGLLGVVNSAMLRRGRRYFIVLAFVIAAVLSPTPDVINQTLMAIPMLLFYEVGIILMSIIEKRRKAQEELEAAEESE